MGLPDKLFKSPPETKEKPEIIETGRIADAPGAEPLGRTDPARDLAVASPGLSSANASAGTATHGGPHDTIASQRSAARAEIVFTLGEILSRIPTQFLRPGMHDAERELHLRSSDLSGANTDRPTVALPRIALQCPTVFNTAAEGFTAMQISLPAEAVRKQLVTGVSDAQTQESATAARVAPGESFETSARLELSLAAVLKRCPREMVIGDLPRLDENAQITLPLAQIEQQLPTGKVEISALEFIAALPSAVRQHFRAVEGLKVALPLQEILEKLPPQPQSALTPAAPSHEIRNGDSGAVEERPSPATRSGLDMAPDGRIAQNGAAPRMTAPRIRPVLVPPLVLPASSPLVSRNAQEMWQLAGTLVVLPGLRACIIAARGELAHAGELPEGVDPGNIRTLATLLASALRGAPGMPLNGVREIVIQGQAFSLAFFLTADVAIAAVTQARSLVEGVAERLLDAAAELSIMRA
jgi:hypothetical protein